MNHFYKVFSFLAVLGLMPCPLIAQDEAPAAQSSIATKVTENKKKSKRNTKPRTTVGRAIENLEYVTESRPNPKAKNFIYLFSASWCNSCKLYMPKFVDEYPKMAKKNQVEIILMSPDSEENIKKYVEQYKIDFPALAFSSQNTKLKSLPGMQSYENIPYAIMVNGRGDTLYAGTATGIMNWESLISKTPVKKRIRKSASESETP